MGFNGALILMAFIFIASAILLAITNNPAFIAGIILSIVGVFALFIVDFDDEKYPSRKIQKQKRKVSKKKKR